MRTEFIVLNRFVLYTVNVVQPSKFIVIGSYDPLKFKQINKSDCIICLLCKPKYYGFSDTFPSM